MDLTSATIDELVAEIERRATALAPPEVYYYGVWSAGSAGHYLYSEDGNRAPGHVPSSIDGTHIDGGFCPAGTQAEGEACIAHVRGWTLISFWDRSGDPRGGCSSSYLISGSHTFAAAVILAKARYPSIWARYSFRVTMSGQPFGHSLSKIPA